MPVASKLQALMNIPGATAASVFAEDGRVTAHAGDVTERAAEVVAMMRTANTLMGNMQAKSWSAHTQQEGFYPVHGFTVAGGRYAVCIMGHACVFLELAKADFDQAYKVLSQYL